MTYKELQEQNAQREKLKALFNGDNTHWEDGYLVYDGEFEELAREVGADKFAVYDAFCEYEQDSKDLIEHQAEIDDARRGEY